MNPDFLTPGEKEFFAQEKSITDAVINVIAVAKNETQYVTDESTKQAIVEACKVSVQKTRHFQALTQGTSNVLHLHRYNVYLQNYRFLSIKKTKYQRIGKLNAEKVTLNAKCVGVFLSANHQQLPPSSMVSQ